MGVVRKGLEWAVMKYLTLSGRALEVLIGTWKIFSIYVKRVAAMISIRNITSNVSHHHSHQYQNCNQWTVGTIPGIQYS